MQNTLKVLLLLSLFMTACKSSGLSSSNHLDAKETLFILNNFFERKGYEVIVRCSMCEVKITEFNPQTRQLEIFYPHGEECPNSGENAVFPISQQEIESLNKQLSFTSK